MLQNESAVNSSSCHILSPLAMHTC